MTLRRIMQNSVATLPDSGSIRDAARLMHQNHVGSVVVVGRDKKSALVPVGIITDRDIALAIGDEQNFDANSSIKNVMSPNVLLCHEEDGVYRTIQNMRDHGVRRMPVVDKQNHLVGIVAADDLLNLLGKEVWSLSKIAKREAENEDWLERKKAPKSELQIAH